MTRSDVKGSYPLGAFSSSGEPAMLTVNLLTMGCFDILSSEVVLI